MATPLDDIFDNFFNLSVPSPTFLIADVPEVKGLNTKFEYLGYQINEGSSNRSGGTRKVSISFISVEDTVDFRNTAAVDILEIPGKSTIVEYLNSGQFIDESRSTLSAFSEILVQDVFSEEKSVQLFQEALAGTNVQVDALSPTEGTSVIKNLISLETPEASFTVSDEVVSSLIQQGAINESIPDNDLDASTTIAGLSSGVQFLNFVDKKISGDVVRASSANPLTAFSDNFSFSQSTYDGESSEAISSFDESVLSDEDYTFDSFPIATKEYTGPVQSLLIGDALVVGYFIEKLSVSEDGQYTFEDGYYIEQPEVSGQEIVFEDDRVSLGRTYAYSISTIAIANVPNVQIDDDGARGTSSFIVKSRIQTSVITTGSGYPEPPVDIEYFYDIESGNLSISWSPSPENTNVVKYQIFRRRSTSEPFELIRQYDFDNSVDQFEGTEDVDYGLNVKLERELLFYIDENFRSSDKYIYAICSINSSGASSPFSSQTMVSVDASVGDISAVQVSPAGAPKPYPNFYLNSELTSQLGKITGAKSATVFFTPEVYNATKNMFDPVTGEILSTEAITVFRTNGPLQNNGEYLLEITELQTLQSSTDSIIVNAGSEAFELFTS
jgi:hypothetical protein